MRVFNWAIIFRCRSCRAIVENGMQIQKRVMEDRDMYKAMLFDAYKGAASQTKGMQRMARKIKRLKAEVKHLEMLLDIRDTQTLVAASHAATDAGVKP